jgi:hypothetical protein
VIRIVAGAALAAFVTLAPLTARAAGWHYYDPDCPIPLAAGGAATGEKSMKFVSMQPKKNIDRECAALPDVGPSVIVLDAADSELRDMVWDIRILRGGPEKIADPEADLVRKLEPQKFRNGMVNFDHVFKEPDNYQLYVKLTSDDGAKSFVGRHGFSVGLVTETELYLYIAFGVFAAAMGAVAFVMWRQGKLGFKIPDFSKPS